MRELFAIGDSHTTFFARAGIMKSHWLGVINIATWYQLLKKNLDIFNLTDRLSKSDHYVNVGVYEWQCPSGVYDVIDVKAGDFVIFCYGFNDIQKNIYKYARHDAEHEIYSLINKYLLLLREFEDKYKISCVPCSIMPNPIEWLVDKKEVAYGCYGDFVSLGTSAERNEYTVYANKTIKELCIKYGLQFFDIYNEVSDHNGFIKKELTMDYVHLNHENIEIVKTVTRKLRELKI